MRLLRATLLLLCLYGSAVGDITDYYVELADATTGNAGTVDDPYSWADVTTLMADNDTNEAGKRFNVRGSITRTGTDTWAADGTATSPIIFRGCTGTGTTWTPITPTRSNGGTGPLVVTGYPVIAYNGNYQLTASVADNVLFTAFTMSSAKLGYGTLDLGNGGAAIGCHVSNSGSHAIANAIRAYGVASLVLSCDTSCSAGTSGPAILLQGVHSRAIGNRVSDSASYGIQMTDSAQIAIGNVIYGTSGSGIYRSSTNANTVCTIVGNTIYGGFGLRYPNVSYNYPDIVAGNSITDGGGYAIYGPGTSGAIHLFYNRTRDNASEASNWAGDWDEATSLGHVTTDNGDHRTDFSDALTADFRLVSDAAGVKQGIMGADIGAIQRADPTLPDASTVLSETYGGSTWGDSFALRRGTATLPAAANVWYGSGSFGVLWATEATVRGTMGNDGDNLIFTSYSPLPAGVEVGHEIMIAGKWAEISAINVARTESTIINPEAGFPESGTLLVATISSTGLSPVVPSKRASSIAVTNGTGATLSAPDIKLNVIVDDLTGSLSGGGLTAQESRDAMSLAPTEAVPSPGDTVDTAQKLRDAMQLAPTGD